MKRMRYKNVDGKSFKQELLSIILFGSWYSKFVLLLFRLSSRITILLAQRTTLENGSVILDLSSFVMVQASAFCFYILRRLSYPFAFWFINQNSKLPVLPHVIMLDVTETLLVEVDQIYHLACPASPIFYKYNPVKVLEFEQLCVR